MKAADEELEGSYLHYSKEEFRWIRSGKAAGSGMDGTKNGNVKRNEDGHRKAVAKASLLGGECFYTLYPSQSNTNQLPEHRGYFEDLDQYCGLCFKQDENTEPLVSTSAGTGLFDWSLYIIALEKSKVSGCQSLSDKQLTVVSYFFKMCYDICILPKHNVSNNPGFEIILGVFNNTKSV